jgi:hypothetical protein
MAKNAPVDNGDSFCRAPIGIVDWSARVGDKEVAVKAHTWFEAREKASTMLDEPNIQSIVVTQKVTDNCVNSTSLPKSECVASRCSASCKP